MSDDIKAVLLKKYPNLDPEEISQLAEDLDAGLHKLEAEGRKYESLLISGPRRNLAVVAKALRAARDVTPSTQKPGETMTKGEVATLLDCSVSKVRRIENGKCMASRQDIEAMAGLYGLGEAVTKALVKARRG